MPAALLAAAACAPRFPTPPPAGPLFRGPVVQPPIVLDLSWLWALAAGVVCGLALGWLLRRRALARALRTRRAKVDGDHLSALEAVLVILESLLLNCRRTSKVVDLLERLRRNGEE